MTRFICIIPLFLLIAGKGKVPLLGSLLIFTIILCAALFIQKKRGIQLHFNINYPILTSLVSLIFAAIFYLRWNNSGRIQPIARLFHLPLKQSCVLVALLLAWLSLIGIDHLLTTFIALFTQKGSAETHNVHKGSIAAFIALTTFTVLFLNSRCSPFYPFNDWGDPNTMFTVGKGVLRGYVPYRDLYEQKGPILIFLHTFGAAVSFDTFLGIWFLELIACFTFLYLAYKTVALFFGNKSLLTVPLLAAIIFSPYAFRTGDTAEEFALPMLSYALYLGCRAINHNTLPSRKEFFLIGITSGAVFWMKYSMTGFYLGWFLAIIIFVVTKRNYHDLIKGCCLIFIGIIITIIPVFLYFILNKSLNELLLAYFYNNIVYYPKVYTFADIMKKGIESCKLYFGGASLFTALGLFWVLLNKHFKLCLYIILTFFTTIFFIYCGGSRGEYYCLPLGIFSVFGFCCIMDILFAVSRTGNFYSFSAGSLFIGLLILCSFSHNLRFLEFDKPKMFQYQMKDIIEKSGNTNPSILYYQILDAGVNTVVGSIPDIRFFCYLNISEKMTEIKETQDKCIEEQCVDYIIARTKFDNVYPHFETYEHRDSIVGMADRTLEYFHYYTPKSSN